MKQFLLNILPKTKRVVALHVHLSKEGTEELQWTPYAFSKGSLERDKEKAGEGNWEAFFEANNPNVPVCLVLTGKGILWKKVPPYTNESEIFSLTMPGVDEQDFDYQTYTQGDTQMMGIVRRSVVNRLTTKLEDEKYRIVEMSISEASVIEVVAMVGESVGLNVGEVSLEYSNNQVNLSKGLPQNESKADLDGEEYSGVDLLLLSSALMFFSQKPSTVNGISLAREEEQHRLEMRTSGIAAIVVLLAALLINFFVFSSRQDQLQQLQYTSTSQGDWIGEVERLKSEILTKEQLLSSTGMADVHGSSGYADQLALIMPKTILLNSAELFPHTKKIKKNKPIERDNGAIKVSGNTSSTGDLNEWMNELRELQWIASVEMTKYYREGKKQGDFEFKIRLKS